MCGFGYYGFWRDNRFLFVSPWVFCFSASPPGSSCCSCSLRCRLGCKAGGTGSELGLRLFLISQSGRRAGLWSGFFFQSDETNMFLSSFSSSESHSWSVLFTGRVLGCSRQLTVCTLEKIRWKAAWWLQLCSYVEMHFTLAVPTRKVVSLHLAISLRGRLVL